MTKCPSVLGIGILLACGTFAAEARAVDEPEVSTSPKPIDASHSAIPVMVYLWLIKNSTLERLAKAHLFDRSADRRTSCPM